MKSRALYYLFSTFSKGVAVTMFFTRPRRQVYGLSPLHLAIFANDFALVRDLVATGAPLEDRLRLLENHTPLHLAAELFRVDMVRLLVEAGADVNAQLDLQVVNPRVPVNIATGIDDDTCGTYHISPLHQVSNGKLNRTITRCVQSKLSTQQIRWRID